MYVPPVAAFDPNQLPDAMQITVDGDADHVTPTCPPAAMIVGLTLTLTTGGNGATVTVTDFDALKLFAVQVSVYDVVAGTFTYNAPNGS